MMLFFYTASLMIVSAPYDFNPTSMIHFGHYYIEQNQTLTPDGSIRFLGNEHYGGNGYDGQIFYYFARSLFQENAWPEGFNNAYRAPRVGYPFLAALFSVFGSWGTVAGMILTQIFLSVFSLHALLKILPADKRYLAVFYIVSPFSLQSFTVLVSDSVMVSLLMIGYFFFLRMKEDLKRISLNDLFTFIFFSMAVLTKESSLFFLFPLGLYSLFQKNLKKIILMLIILFPMVLWQVYLRQAHGMIPAGVLKVFLSPLDGILGLLVSSWELLYNFFQTPGFSSAVQLLKHSIKWLLVILILTSLQSIITVKSRSFLNRDFPLRLGIALTLFSVLLADYYYFWGIYENISRMFTILVPLMILYASGDVIRKKNLFFITLSILSLMVIFRMSFISPVHPHDVYRHYSGKNYGDHAPVLQKQ
ncbi:MAG: hypothetical protein OEZ34_01215 [Spirochaetia bacterium]|nr:hypothetical protein [Spirochaetia bacterium]